MPFQLRPGTPADVPGMVEVYFSAFSDNPVALSCFPPSSTAAHEFWISLLEEEIGDPRAHFLVITDPALADPSTIIAFAKWVSPAKDGDEQVPPPPPKDIWPKDGNPDFADEFFSGIARKHAEIMGDVPHWYLELVACRKEHQGRGAAGPLMKWGCDRIDEAGELAFLESMVKATALYERYGFKTLERLEFTAPGGVVSQDFMLREGKASDQLKSLVGKRQ